jgi:hypothetical protein
LGFARSREAAKGKKKGGLVRAEARRRGEIGVSGVFPAKPIQVSSASPEWVQCFETALNSPRLRASARTHLFF